LPLEATPTTHDGANLSAAQRIEDLGRARHMPAEVAAYAPPPDGAPLGWGAGAEATALLFLAACASRGRAPVQALIYLMSQRLAAKNGAGRWGRCGCSQGVPPAAVKRRPAHCVLLRAGAPIASIA